MKELVDCVPIAQFESMLENLERRVIITDDLGQRARTLSLAGDLCFDAGQPERGLSYFDRAITLYTETGQYEIAARMCEKILALWPQAVRTYWTLAWLALKRGVPNAARVRIAQYVVAAENHGLERVAATYLAKLADSSATAEVLETIGQGLLQLDDIRGADVVFGMMHQANARA
jgi:tetratricopeptide (TPR) repeat protein